MTSAEMVVVGMKHIVCFSGGHSSAIAAVEVVRKFGAEDTILLNHDLCPRTEDADIKRFKKQVSDYLGVPITYANMPGWDVKDQFDVCMEIKAFKAGTQSTAFCTNRLKTEPFHKWLAEHYPANPPEVRYDISLVYGFDANEQHRIRRRVGIMATMGYQTEYPLTWEVRTIHDIEEYSTKFGDSAGDFSPLANLMVHEVIQIGYELLLPINLISKIPSDGLCGKTDEDNLGFTYAHLDAYIMYGTSGIEEIDKKIASMHDHNLHKFNPMPAYGTTIF